MNCDSPAALQEHHDKQIQSVTTETEGATGMNGVSDVTRRGEEPAAEGANDRVEQVIDSKHTLKQHETKQQTNVCISVFSPVSSLSRTSQGLSYTVSFYQAELKQRLLPSHVTSQSCLVREK